MIQAPVFRAVQEPHGYFLGTQELDSPSSVFAELGLVDRRFYTPRSRSRGRAIHAALHLILRDSLTFEQFLSKYDFHQDLKGYVQSGLLWWERRRPRVLRLETPLYHPALLFAGTFDVEWELDGWNWIVDYKTGKAGKIARYQMAAYAMMAARLGVVRPHKRAALELQEDGTIANLVSYDDPTDGAGWLNLLGAARIRKALRSPLIAVDPPGEIDPWK